MRFEEKIHELKNKIESTILPLIDNDYVLWEVPYYTNIGDTLIWEGELCLLCNCQFKCLGMASKDTCMFPELSKETIILLQGGGNFGDLWREIQEFRLKVIETYPDNKIIMFPQSVFYEDVELMHLDAQRMASHDRLILCARDHSSYNILKRNFKNQILLLPDMAFCISEEKLNQKHAKNNNKVLFLKRLDKEAVGGVDTNNIQEKCFEVRDWPSIDSPSILILLLSRVINLQARFIKKNRVNRMFASCVDWLGFCLMRHCLLKQGVRFLNGYERIYTTRLHVMILSILLHKEVVCIDNSYGKNRSFYETWLADIHGVAPYWR